MASAPWLLLQLSDGNFPNGGFAHSGGLEAAMVLGSIDAAAPDVMAKFLDASIHQIAQATLPFVRATATDPSRLVELDEAFDATMPMLAPNTASRSQGRALANAASRIWDVTSSIAEHSRKGPSHHGPIFGAVFGTLGVSSDETLVAYIHTAARSLLSAGVRLGLLGPLEAQRLLADRAPLFETMLSRSGAAPLADAAQTAPLIEIFAALHDRLDGRMFQS